MKRTVLIVPIIIIVAFLLMFLSNSTCWAQDSSQPLKKTNEICRICGMYIERFKHTAVYIDYKSGSSQAYCGVSCAIRSINEHGGMDEVKSAHVTGWISEKPMELKTASYVIGSKLIPDMIPNIIAFDSKEEADEFIKKQGGKIESLDSLLTSTSYRGLTAPFRIPAAAVPSQGVFNFSSGASARFMNGLMSKDDSITDTEAFKTRTSIMDKMTTYMFTQALGYGVTDDLFLSVSFPYAKKKVISINRSNGSTVQTDKEGLCDIPIMARWRFWHDTYFDKHLGVLGTVTTPTGNYDSAIRDRNTVQLGNGAPGFTFGPLYSQHVGKFWFHVAATYKWNLENSDDYKFGDTFNYGFAIHYLPNTSDLLGFEFDGETCYKNEYRGLKVLNTGRRALYSNFVYQKRVLFCFGGNVNVSGLFGFPVYQRVKDIQLGEKYHASAAIQWQRKF